MSFEAELKSTYSQVHARLLKPSPRPRFSPRPAQVSPQSTAKKPIVHVPIRVWDDVPPFSPLPQDILTVSAPIRLAVILKLISTTEVISIMELRSQRRPKYVTDARGIYYYLARKYTECSWPGIGRFLGGRDHSTVVSGARRMERLCATDAHWRARVAEYEAKLEGKAIPTTHSLLPPGVVIEWIGA